MSVQLEIITNLTFTVFPSRIGFKALERDRTALEVAILDFGLSKAG